MKIAVFHELPPGGALMVVHQMTKRLKKEHTVDLYTTSASRKHKDSSFFSNTFLYSFRPKKWEGKDWKTRLYKDTIELIKLYLIHRKIAKDIRKRDYDIFFVHGSKYIEAPFVLRFINKNKIFYCHDPNYRFVYEPILDDSSNLDFIRKTYEKINRLVRKHLDLVNIKSADTLIASSKFERSIIKKTYNLGSVVIPYGVDSDFFRQAKVKKLYDVLYLGASHILEGYPTLIKIESLLSPQIKVKKILGDIEWISDMRELRLLYQTSRMVICLGHNEPFGLTPLDAMACGVPVIAVKEGGYRETVKDSKTGYLIRRNPKEMAEKIEALLKNKQLLEKMGRNGRQHVLKSWTWDVNIKRLNNLFNSMQ